MSAKTHCISRNAGLSPQPTPRVKIGCPHICQRIPPVASANCWRIAASQYRAVGAFVEAALTYVSEEDALEGRQVAALTVMATYAPAKVPQDVSTETSTRARVRWHEGLGRAAVEGLGVENGKLKRLLAHSMLEVDAMREVLHRK